MLAFKLVRKMKDGYAPLFINKRLRMKPGIAYQAENLPTKGFAERFGWHCTLEPEAPHLKEDIDNRVWVVVQLNTGRGSKEDVENPEGMIRYYERPESQGGTWVLCTGTMTILGEEDKTCKIETTDGNGETTVMKAFTMEYTI